MSNKTLWPIVRDIIEKLVQGEYSLVISTCPSSRMTADQIQEAIKAYGRHLVMPPDDASKHLDVVEIKKAQIPTFSVIMPLWTKEDGRSDLTLELTVSLERNNPKVELDGLHVL